MDEKLLVISAPVASRSGYGEHSRDLVHSLIRMNKYDVKIISTKWGDCPMNALAGNDLNDKKLLTRVLTEPLDKQPDIFIQLTVPNEFQPIGKWSCGITAGIETTVAPHEWVDGCNRMDLVIVPSKHSRDVLSNTNYTKVDKRTGQQTGPFMIQKPIEVLFEGINLDVFGKKHNDDILNKSLSEIKEDFNFLFVGHWLSGDLGEDRKNVGFLVKTFFTLFENVPNPPGLILKTSSATFSVLDREDILNKIRSIKSSFVNKDKLPNVYVIHGDLTPNQMSGLYRHDKVKCHISFTKGEGFGRPLLEASLSGRPIIASGWSGHLDFLNKEDSILLSGTLNSVHPSAANEFLLRESHWFNVSLSEAARGMLDVYANYEKHLDGAKRLAKKNSEKFSMENMDEGFSKLLEKYTVTPEEIEIKLPELKLPELSDA